LRTACYLLLFSAAGAWTLQTEFLIFGLPQQLPKLNNPTIHLPNDVILSPVDSPRNLGVIFDENLSFAQHISSISK